MLQRSMWMWMWMAILLVVPVAAQAGLTQIFKVDDSADRSAWEAAVGGDFTLETFDDAGLEPGVILSSDTSALQIVSGRFEDTPNGATSTMFSFSPDVMAAGLFVDLNPTTVGTGLDIHVFFQGGGSEIIEVRNDTLNGGSTTEGFDGFVGFVANMPITQVKIFEGDQTNLGGAGMYHGDDLVFAYGQPVPVVSPWGLGILALCLVAASGALRCLRGEHRWLRQRVDLP